MNPRNASNFVICWSERWACCGIAGNHECHSLFCPVLAGERSFLSAAHQHQAPYAYPDSSCLVNLAGFKLPKLQQHSEISMQVLSRRLSAMVLSSYVWPFCTNRPFFWGGPIVGQEGSLPTWAGPLAGRGCLGDQVDYKRSCPEGMARIGGGWTLPALSG